MLTQFAVSKSVNILKIKHYRINVFNVISVEITNRIYPFIHDKVYTQILDVKKNTNSLFCLFPNYIKRLYRQGVGFDKKGLELQKMKVQLDK